MKQGLGEGRSVQCILFDPGSQTQSLFSPHLSLSLLTMKTPLSGLTMLDLNSEGLSESETLSLDG